MRTANQLYFRHRVAAKLDDLRVTDRSLIWNTDLMETLELTNLIPNAPATIVAARIKGNKVTLSYRDVHLKPLTSEADGGIDLKRIAPKERVY